MTATPLVSIIVPFLNEERFLADAIASVRAQTWPRWELLLVDDGSQDGSPAIARAAAARDPGRVRYLEHPGHANRGTSASRNLGLRHARGELVAYLDGDDLYLPGKLAGQVAALAAHPGVGAVYGPCLFWLFDYNNDGGTVRDSVQDVGVPAGTVLPPPQLLTLILGNEGMQPTTCGLMVRRSLCEAVGGWDESFRDMYDDSIFVAKLMLAADILVSDECACAYRLHLGSTCHQAREAGEYDQKRPSRARGLFLRWLEDHLRRRGIRDPALRAALRRELRPYAHPLVRGARAALRPLRKGEERPAPSATAPGPMPASAALRALARFHRDLGHSEEAQALERKALRVLARRRSRTGTVAAADGSLRLAGLELPHGGSVLDAPAGGHILALRTDKAGRRVGFAFAEPAPAPAGTAVQLRPALVDRSLNAHLLRTGQAYPAFDPTLPDGVRTVLAQAVAEGRRAGAGLWAADSGNPKTSAAVSSPADVARLTMWPRLRRLLTAFFAHGGREIARFPAWLREVGPDEPVLLLPDGEPGRLSDLIEAGPGTVRLRAWPESVLTFPGAGGSDPPRPPEAVEQRPAHHGDHQEHREIAVTP